MDPTAAIEAAKAAEEAFRRDYLVASVVILLGVNVAWGLAVRALVNALGKAQEARVLDQKEDRGRYEALVDRTSVHLDRVSEMSTLLLADAQRKAKFKRGGTDPGTGA